MLSPLARIKRDFLRRHYTVRLISRNLSVLVKLSSPLSTIRVARQVPYLFICHRGREEMYALINEESAATL